MKRHMMPDSNQNSLARTKCQAVRDVLHRRTPHRIVYAPNYWQWFSHHQRHRTLPPDLADCRDQLDVIRRLGLDVFSRNTYCDQRRCWFGGLCELDWHEVRTEERERAEGDGLILDRIFHTAAGPLTERQRYCHDQSTLVQEKFVIDDYNAQWEAYERLVHGRRWRFVSERYEREQSRVGDDGIVIAGELFSPLKMLHLDMGPEATTYFLMDQPDRAMQLLRVHEQAQLDLVRQMAEAGVPAMMAMDNLDAMFHPPAYVRRYSASFYEQAARLCHDHGSAFFIHACGQQRANLQLIASLGVDGLEGVAYPPLGDIELDQAFELTGDRFIITGGISAAETDRLHTRRQVFDYVGELFERMRPYAHRFVFAASCNTAISARWETLVHFRDAWLECGSL